MLITRNYKKKSARLATYSDLLTLTILDKDHQRYLDLSRAAANLFCAGKTRAAFNLLNTMWVHPHIVPALVLAECFTLGAPIIPAWNNFPKYTWVNKPKPDGSMRPIVVPCPETRIAMGVVNSMLQASSESWSLRTHGFRPASLTTSATFGTHSAMKALSNATVRTLQLNPAVTLVLFDIKKAFNSVDLNHLFYTLHLDQLPHDIKYYIWQWQNTPLFNNRIIDGLAQGFSYSPTLFAWYLDALFLKAFGAYNEEHPDFIIYADNVVGIFSSERAASDALALLESVLQPAGLCINPASVKRQTVNKAGGAGNLPWLGHELFLPEGFVHYGVYPQQTGHAQSSSQTLAAWARALTTSNWYNRVHAEEWRLSLKRKA